MYGDHIAQCNALAQRDVRHFRNMLTFVLATIQQQLETIPDILADFDAIGSESRFAFASKARGLDYIAAHSGRLYRDAMAARDQDCELMAVFLRVPGIGLVKAGFCAQLFAGRVGCLDVHNLKLYDIPASAVAFNKKLKSAELRAAKIAAYVDTCRELGGCVKLWQNWCEYKASLIPGNWQNAGASVSLMHVEAITRDFRNTVPDLFAGVDYEPKFSVNYGGKEL